MTSRVMWSAGGSITAMSSETPVLCERCGHPREDHILFIDAQGTDRDRYTEALFPEPWRGLYCPHLDMVKGEDYER